MFLYFLGVIAEGLVAFWPLTQESQGENLAPGGTDLQLHGVEFPEDPGNVMATMMMMMMMMMMMIMMMMVMMMMMMMMIPVMTRIILLFSF